MSDIGRLGADFESHYIEGFAVQGGGHFSAPLISHVKGNLWQGGCIGGVKLPDDFKFVLSLYKWEEYKLGPDTERFTVEMYDSRGGVDEQQLVELANMVNENLKFGKVLVHCQAGLNRSGMVAALSMMLDGLTADEAINLLRQSRSPMVLCNPTFEKFLRNYDGT